MKVHKRFLTVFLVLLTIIITNGQFQQPVSAQTDQSAKGYLDTQIARKVLKGTQNIAGWFLNKNGVASIEVLVDDRVVGQANYGDARPDVLRAFPEFGNGTAGFQFALDTAIFEDGEHTFAIKGTGNDGQVTMFSQTNIKISNENTKGYIDNPASGSILKGTHRLSGWFLDRTGVAKIDILVDGKFVGNANYGDARPDVQTVFPEFNNSNAGFHYSLDTTKFNNGQHTITIRETAANGRVATLPPLNVTIANEEPKGYIDSLTSGMIISATKNVSGWFLNKSGVEKIEVLVDGRSVGYATYGHDRPDVQKAYPEFNNANAGYHYSLDTTKFSDGKHRVTVIGIGKNSQVTTLGDTNVMIENVKGYVDFPNSNAKLTGIKKLSGWYLNAHGVEKIEVLVDGKVVGQATYGDERLDVKKIYPDFNNDNAGYQFLLDTTQFSDGQHKVSVIGIGKNAQVTTLSDSNVTFENAKGYVDYPNSNAKLTGIKKVSGWYLNASGIEKIEVLVDGQVVGHATYGDERLDVKKIYPDFNNEKAGYHYLLDTTQFSDGQHKVSVRGIGKNGQVATLSDSNVTFENAKGYVDYPNTNATLTGIKKVSGWYLNANGVEKIEVLVDGQVVGHATYGDERPDVKKLLPDFNNDKAGYHYLLDTTKFSDGQHKVSVRGIGKNGQVTSLSDSNVTFKNVIGFIDNLYTGNVLKGNHRISGWFLDIAGVDKVEVLVDGQVIGLATYGVDRPDVLKAFPDFKNAKAGFHYTLDTTKFSNGQHTISIRGIAKNGRLTKFPGINVTFKQSRTVFLDPGHGGYDSGAVFGSIREADLNLTVAKKVESLLLSRGYEVIMSRNNNTYVSLLDRSIMANGLGPDIFVSIHHNNAISSSSNGIESYYYEFDAGYPPKINQHMHNNIERIEKSVKLTNIIQNNMLSYTGANNRGTDGAAFSVIREAAMPATLLELGFISNYNERQNLISGSYQDKLARAIADGIDVYLKKY